MKDSNDLLISEWFYIVNIRREQEIENIKSRRPAKVGGGQSQNRAPKPCKCPYEDKVLATFLHLWASVICYQLILWDLVNEFTQNTKQKRIHHP